VENQGQWGREISFVTHQAGLTAFFTGRGLTLVREQREGDRLRGVAVRLTFEAASNRTVVEGVDPLPGIRNYFIGNDPGRWKTGVRGFRQVLYRGVQDGVDVRFRDGDGRIEYDVEVAPGADLEGLIVACEGIEGLEVDDDGTLVMHTDRGPIRQKPPTTWQVLASGERRPVACGYRILDAHRYGFEVPGRDRTLAMVIDPGLVWCTFLGGRRYDFATDVKVDATGAVTVCGTTSSSDFPTQAGSYDTRLSGNSDVFVTRLDATGSRLLFSTFLGGRGDEAAERMVLAGNGDVLLTGNTDSSDYPTTPGAHNTTYNGGGDAFVTRLNTSGNALQFSTYLGGSAYDHGYDLALDVTGQVVVAGLTYSSNYPTTTGVYDTTYNGGGDSFVTLLNVGGSQPVFSTFLGGTDREAALTVGVDNAGIVTLAGQAWGTNNKSSFPTTAGAYAGTYGGGKSDAYVARLNNTGTTLIYSTFLGGVNSDPMRELHLVPGGAVVLVGQTYSPAFPTTPGAFDTTYNGNGDAFVVRLNNSGSSLVYGTFIGGANKDEGTSIALDSSGAMTVGGWTEATDFPTTPGAFQRSLLSTNGDGFLIRLDPAGKTAWYSTYIGGKSWDTVRALALDPWNDATLVGEVWSSDYPVTSTAYDKIYNNSGDAHISRLDLLPTGVQRYGLSTPACNGPVVAGVTRMPRAGDAQFAFTCINASPNTAGILAVGFASSVRGIPIANVRAYLNPAVPFLAFLAVSDATGASTVRVPIPAGTKGVRVYCQFFMSTTVACPGSGPLSASNALDMIIQ